MKGKGITWIWNKFGSDSGQLSATIANSDASLDQKAPLTSAGQRTSYSVARNIARVVSIIGWIVVIISLYELFHLGLTMLSLYLIVGGFVSGLLLVVASQLTRAIIDTADNTGQILELMKSKNENDVK